MKSQVNGNEFISYQIACDKGQEEHTVLRGRSTTHVSQLFTGQLLEVDQVEAYCATQRAADLDSGVGGQPHSHAYPRAYPYVLSEALVRTRKRWQPPRPPPLGGSRAARAGTPARGRSAPAQHPEEEAEAWGG